MEGIQKPRKPRGTWQPGRRMKMRGGEGKGTNMGEKKSLIFFGRVSVSLGMSLQWGVTVTIVVPVLQAS